MSQKPNTQQSNKKPTETPKTRTPPPFSLDSPITAKGPSKNHYLGISDFETLPVGVTFEEFNQVKKGRGYAIAGKVKGYSKLFFLNNESRSNMSYVAKSFKEALHMRWIVRANSDNTGVEIAGKQE